MKERYTVSRDDSIYEAWPDVVLNSRGELICIFTQCAFHLDRKGVSLMMTKSRDKGATWSKKKVFAASPDDTYTYNCARINVLPDGRLAVICDIGVDMAGKKESLVSKQHVWFSYDDGDTWKGPMAIPFRGIVPDKYRVLSNGRHFFAIHRKTDAGNLAQYAVYSDDGGETWRETLVAHDPDLNLCEASVVEVAPGVLVAFMRENSKRGLPCKKAISHDYGTTWEGVYDTNIECVHRPVVDFYEDGKLMMTYRYSQGGRASMHDRFQNLFAAFFNTDTALAKELADNKSRIFPLHYDRSPMADTGYSGWVRLDDGDFYVVNYTVDDAPKAYIVGYRFGLSDVILQ